MFSHSPPSLSSGSFLLSNPLRFLSFAAIEPSSRRHAMGRFCSQPSFALFSVVCDMAVATAFFLSPSSSTVFSPHQLFTRWGVECALDRDYTLSRSAYSISNSPRWGIFCLACVFFERKADLMLTQNVKEERE